MDIGNHNGVNKVEWSKSSRHFSLTNRESLTQGDQIYNFYGDKSNSELLIGYGFTLPSLEKDTVHLRLTPGPEAVRLRRAQVSHVMDSNQPEQEFMFHVKLPIKSMDSDQGLAKLQVFSPGLVDTMSCMVANRRERQFLEANLEHSAEMGPVGGPLSRNLLLVVRILRDKLRYELARIEQYSKGLG